MVICSLIGSVNTCMYGICAANDKDYVKYITTMNVHDLRSRSVQPTLEAFLVQISVVREMVKQKTPRPEIPDERRSW